MPREPRFDLTSFSLLEMTQSGAHLRSLGVGATSLEELGDRIVQFLFDGFRDPATGERQCALVRMFKTHTRGDLPRDLRELTAATTQDPLDDETPCLTLLATAGLEQAWNSRATSVGHKVIPLPSPDAVHKLPMIAQMLKQFGLQMQSDDFLSGDILLGGDPKSFNVFHVDEAHGSPYVPSQEDFVIPFGIRSVVGFGGRLSSGDIFAVILFCRVKVPSDTAELFPPLALNTLAACLHVDPAATFADGSRPDTPAPQSFESQTYEDLLRAQDRILLSQWARLEAAEEERDRFFSLSLDMLCVAGMDGHFRRVNPSFSRTLGYSDEELLSQPFTDLIHPEDREATKAAMKKLAKGGDVTQFYNRYRCKDGTYRWLSWSCPAPRGDSAALYAVARDITANIEDQRRLQEARAAAEAANRAKDAFLATMSHEIRTPLNSILGFTQLVLDTPVEPFQRHWLETVMQSGDSLVAIINDILDFSKLQAGKFSLETSWFGLRETLGQTAEAMAAQAHTAGLELMVHVHADVPDSVLGDPIRIRQIVTNLLANAVKFTDEGEVGLRVTVDESTDRAAILHFAVHDTGVGIPVEERESIFSPFTQADMSSSRRFGGSGLGLSICSSLVSQMGGQIRVESEVGAGSTFHVTIPFEHRVEERTPAALPNATDVKVVVADDHPTNRKILAEYLQAWGMHPSLHATGAGALEAMQEAVESHEPTPLLIADAEMPGMDGFELVERVRDASSSCQAILMLTARALPESTARAASLGATWVVKPVSVSRLLEAIHQTTSDEPRIPTARTDTDAGAKPRPAPLRVLLAEDSQTSRTLFVALLRRRGHVVTVASDGAEALQHARSEEFDLILMDVQMPGKDGLEVTRTLRAEESPGGAVPPIIALTARATRADRQACLAAGMVDCITKPIEIQSFYDTIDRVVGSRAPGAAVNWATALATVNGDRDLLGELVAASKTEVPQLIEAMGKALELEDLETVRRHAHTMRGIVGHFGAGGAEEGATRLEAAAKTADLQAAKAALPGLAVAAESLLASLDRGP